MQSGDGRQELAEARKRQDTQRSEVRRFGRKCKRCWRIGHKEANVPERPQNDEDGNVGCVDAQVKMKVLHSSVSA